LALAFVNIPAVGPLITRIAQKLGTGAGAMAIANVLAKVQENIALKKSIDPELEITDGLMDVAKQGALQGGVFALPHAISEGFKAMRPTEAKSGIVTEPHRAPLEPTGPTTPFEAQNPVEAKPEPAPGQPEPATPSTQPTQPLGPGEQRGAVIEENSELPQEGQIEASPPSRPSTASLPISESINAVRSQPTVDPKESEAARIQYEQEMQGSLKQGQPELLSEIQRAGGLPTVQQLRKTPGENLTGELNRVYDAWKGLDQDSKAWLKKQGVTPSKLFRNDAPGLDEMRGNLAQQGGFNYEVPHELLSDVEAALQNATAREKFLGQRYAGQEPVEFHAGLPIPKISQATREALAGKAREVIWANRENLESQPHTQELRTAIDEWRAKETELHGKGSVLNHRYKELLKSNPKLSKEIDEIGKIVAEGGNIPATISPAAREWLKTANNGLYREIGNRMKAGGFDVELPGGGTRPFIGAPPDVTPFPRIIRPDVTDTLAKPLVDRANNLTPEAKKLYDEGRRTINKNTGRPFFEKPQDLLDLARQYHLEHRQGPMKTNLERARVVKYPSFFYTYSPEAMLNSLWHQGTNLARLEAFGQKIGGKSDLFDKTVERINQDLSLSGPQKARAIKAIEDLRKNVYGLNRSGSTLRLAGGATSATLAGNPATGLKVGESATMIPVVYRGPVRAIRGMAETALKWRDSMADLRSHGLSNETMIHLQDDPYAIKSAEQKATNFFRGWLNIAGWHRVAQDFARSTTLKASKLWLEDAMIKLRNDPNLKNPFNRRIAQDIQRRGMDVKDFMNPNVDQRLKDRFLSEDVLSMQPSYRPERYPAWASTPTGRFIFRFGHWAYDASNLIMRDAVMPLAKATLSKDSRDIPLAGTYLLRLASIGLGAVGASELLRETQKLFGKQSDVATLGEIWQAIAKHDPVAAQLITGRLVQDVVGSPMIGMFGDLWNAGYGLSKGRADTTHTFNPSTPATVGLVNIVIKAFNQAAQQGWQLSDKQKAQIAGSIVTAAREYLNLANTLGVPVPKTLISVSHAETMGQRDSSFVKSRLDLFYSEHPLLDKRSKGGPFAGNAGTPYRQDLVDAWLAGDVQEARQIIKKYQTDLKLTPKELSTSLRDTFDAHSPIPQAKIGPVFTQWAKKTMTPDELQRMHNIQRVYTNTAEKSNGITREPKVGF
jgi:hypothetical protein